MSCLIDSFHQDKRNAKSIQSGSICSSSPVREVVVGVEQVAERNFKSENPPDSDDELERASYKGAGPVPSAKKQKLNTRIAKRKADNSKVQGSGESELESNDEREDSGEGSKNSLVEATALVGAAASAVDSQPRLAAKNAATIKPHVEPTKAETKNTEVISGPPLESEDRRNQKAAHRWAELAEQGHAEGWYRLGLMFLDGTTNLSRSIPISCCNLSADMHKYMDNMPLPGPTLWRHHNNWDNPCTEQPKWAKMPRRIRGKECLDRAADLGHMGAAYYSGAPASLWAKMF